MKDNDFLDAIASFYLESHDFNGIPASSLIRKFGKQETIDALTRLIDGDLASVVFGDYHPNPHIKALPSEPTAEQIKKLNLPIFENSCVYPNTKHLSTIVDASKYADKPFEYNLAIGEPQLSHKSFDLAVLELYRNDPRYAYKHGDIHGNISIRSEYFESSEVRESDQILLSSYGLSFDEASNIYVAVFLRYLTDLTPEHQLIWHAKLTQTKTYLHPDYFRICILGDFQERLSIFQAVLKEMQLINEIVATITARAPFFKHDYSGENRPRSFDYLLRPTLREYNEFVHLLDKMLSENINRDFFNNEVSYEFDEIRKDGKTIVRQKGTISILNDWLRGNFSTNDWSQIDEMISTLKRIRDLRRSPAHAIKEDEFDQQYIREQRELMKSVYRAVKILRITLGLHPSVASVEVDEYLKDGLIWAI